MTTVSKGKAVRNSNIELVRILAMLMIIISHIFGTKSGEEFSGAIQGIFILQNSVFHAGLGVLLFMLISGYFMIKLSLERLTKMITLTFTCSVFGLAVELISSKFLNFNVSLKDVLMHLIPVSSRYYWYISCYICVMVIAPFLNMAINKLSKADYQKILLAIVVLFYVLPTFLYFDVMNDKGKGLITMISAYFIGAYFAKFPIDLNKGKNHLYAIIALIASFLIAFAGNYAATIVRGQTSYPFSRECSLFTLVSGVAILIIAADKSSCNKIINTIASKTIYIYLISCTATALIGKFEITMKYKDDFKVVLFVLALTIATYIVCFLFSIILQYPAALLNKILLAVINKLKSPAEKIMKKTGVLNEDTIG